jgi:hypothetical protein
VPFVPSGLRPGIGCRLGSAANTAVASPVPVMMGLFESLAVSTACWIAFAGVEPMGGVLSAIVVISGEQGCSYPLVNTITTHVKRNS